MKNLIFLIFLLSSVITAQQNSGHELSGRLKIQVGAQVLSPENVLIELEGEDKSTTTDSQGNYCFENLENKKSDLKVFGYTYQPKSFSVNINSTSVENFDLKLKADCLVNGEIAKTDLKNSQPRLLLIGGMIPTIKSGQAEFEKKYDIVYSDFGCMQDPYECVKQYNEVVFTYLDKTYGKGWRKEVRDDVIGFK